MGIGCEIQYINGRKDQEKTKQRLSVLPLEIDDDPPPASRSPDISYQALERLEARESELMEQEGRECSKERKTRQDLAAAEAALTAVEQRQRLLDDTGGGSVDAAAAAGVRHRGGGVPVGDGDAGDGGESIGEEEAKEEDRLSAAMEVVKQVRSRREQYSVK